MKGRRSVLAARSPATCEVATDVRKTLRCAGAKPDRDEDGSARRQPVRPGEGEGGQLWDAWGGPAILYFVFWGGGWGCWSNNDISKHARVGRGDVRPGAKRTICSGD